MSILGFALLLAFAGLGAIVRGGPVEHRGAVLLTIGWAASLTAQIVSGRIAPGIWLTLIDLTVMIGLIALAWKSPHPWPAPACGFQALALAASVAKWVDPDLDDSIHLGLLAVTGYGVVGTLAWGAWFPPARLTK